MRAGLIDISTPNLINLCRPRLDAASEGGGDVALLNSTATYFSLVIVRGGRPIFFRCKSIGDDAAGPDGNGVLVREMAGSLSYYREKLAGRALTTVLVRSRTGAFETIAAKLRRLELDRVEPVCAEEGLDPAGRPVDPLLALRLAPALGAAMGRGR